MAFFVRIIRARPWHRTDSIPDRGAAASKDRTLSIVEQSACVIRTMNLWAIGATHSRKRH